jgi:hypothetical protein
MNIKPLFLFLLFAAFSSTTFSQDEKRFSFGLNIGANNAFMEGTSKISKSLIKPSYLSLGANFGGFMKYRYSQNNSLMTMLYLMSFEQTGAIYKQSIWVGLSSSSPGLAIFNLLDLKKTETYSISFLSGIHLDGMPYGSTSIHQYFNSDGNLELSITNDSHKGLFTSFCAGLSAERFFKRRKIGLQVLFQKGFQTRVTNTLRQYNPDSSVTTYYRGAHLKIQLQWYFGKKSLKQ